MEEEVRSRRLCKKRSDGHTARFQITTLSSNSTVDLRLTDASRPNNGNSLLPSQIAVD